MQIISGGDNQYLAQSMQHMHIKEKISGPAHFSQYWYFSLFNLLQSFLEKTQKHNAKGQLMYIFIAAAL